MYQIENEGNEENTNYGRNEQEHVLLTQNKNIGN